MGIVHLAKCERHPPWSSFDHIILHLVNLPRNYFLNLILQIYNNYAKLGSMHKRI